jgi:hypothetical protein
MSPTASAIITLFKSLPLVEQQLVSNSINQSQNKELKPKKLNRTEQILKAAKIINDATPGANNTAVKTPRQASNRDLDLRY